MRFVSVEWLFICSFIANMTIVWKIPDSIARHLSVSIRDIWFGLCNSSSVMKHDRRNEMQLTFELLLDIERYRRGFTAANIDCVVNFIQRRTTHIKWMYPGFTPLNQPKHWTKYAWLPLLLFLLSGDRKNVYRAYAISGSWWKDRYSRSALHFFSLHKSIFSFVRSFLLGMFFDKI